MIKRLAPFRYLAVALLALLLVVVLLNQEGSPVDPARALAPASTSTSTEPPPRPEHRPVPAGGPATVVHKVETQDRVVFLTIDDGAVRDPAMIEVLRRNGIRATLFLTDSYVKQDPGFFRRLRDETGSTIENHTASHPNLKGRPLDAQQAEIGPVSDAYAATFGTRPTLFRPPFGNYDDATLKAAGEAGAKYLVHWGSEVDKGRIKFSGPHEFRPGSIVLMHFRATFAEDVQAFVDQARANNLTPALLTDYLK